MVAAWYRQCSLLGLPLSFLCGCVLRCLAAVQVICLFGRSHSAEELTRVPVGGPRYSVLQFTRSKPDGPCDLADLIIQDDNLYTKVEVKTVSAQH